MNIKKNLTFCLVLTLFSLFVLQLIPYSLNGPAMSCLTAANEKGDAESVAKYYANSGRDYNATLKYIQNSDFSLRNESVGASDENRTLVFVTEYKNLRCFLVNLISIDGSIIRVDVQQQNSRTIITKVW